MGLGPSGAKAAATSSELKNLISNQRLTFQWPLKKVVKTLLHSINGLRIKLKEVTMMSRISGSKPAAYKEPPLTGKGSNGRDGGRLFSSIGGL